jgi:hypothetical protein
MEAVIHNGQISLPEEILEKAHLPKEGNVELSVGERD